ncbi:MAG: arylsulfatase [Planctomycetota bacterium]
MLFRFGFAFLISVLSAGFLTADEPDRPNIIYIMLDDAGYGDFGAMGSQDVLTPAFDQMCREGMRFTNHYSGSAVCAPTRCVLMTGLHTGHCRRRDNQSMANREMADDRGLVFLKDEDVTVAEALQGAGYVTGGIGKWGLGNPGFPGSPDNQGFDYFLGYLDQVHAHDHYTDWLWLNGDRMETGQRYSHYIFEDATLEFIREHQEEPFFLYLPYCLPHGKYVIPDDDPALDHYRDKPWPDAVKNYAAMITRADMTVERIVDLLEELEIDDNTIIFYTSDNGPNQQFVRPLTSNGPFQGIKRSLYEGGIRAGMAVQWPGHIPAESNSDFIWCMRDVFPTLCELAGTQVPEGLDGISIATVLRGESGPEREHLYWEFPRKSQQAVRMGNWKGLRFGTAGNLQLYDLTSDPGETNDVAAEHPSIVSRMEDIMRESHVDSEFWPLKEKVN